MDFENVWENVVNFLRSFWLSIDVTLFKIGATQITLGTIIYMLVAFIILSFATKVLKRILINRILNKTGMDPGVSVSIGNLTRFFLMLLGLLIIIQTAGINLSALTVLLGALGVGIGFGLQTITDNFISGIIILFEKPIKVGDRVQIDNLAGNVSKISIRATTIITNDNMSIIVPNSEFVSGRVINWSHNDRNIRFDIPVGVSYNENPEHIRKILLEVANENEHVLKNPPPAVFFSEFGDSSLNFHLMVWTSTYIDRPRPFRSMLNYSIHKKFKENNVEIPFPQRDLHIRSGLEKMEK